MITSHETCLTRNEVEEYLSAYEAQYGFSNSDFLLNPELRGQVSEDDSFKWQSYLDHYKELRKMEQETHSAYLSRVSRRASYRKGPDRSYETQANLAA